MLSAVLLRDADEPAQSLEDRIRLQHQVLQAGGVEVPDVSETEMTIDLPMRATGPINGPSRPGNKELLH